MPAIPLCAKAREEAPASRQTTVNAIIGREAVMPKVLRRRGQLMEQAGGEWRKGRRLRSRTNTWRAPGLLMLIRRGRCNRAPSVALGEALPPDGELTLAVVGDAARTGRHDPQVA